MKFGWMWFALLGIHIANAAAQPDAAPVPPAIQPAQGMHGAVGDPEHSLKISDARGRYLAIHFLHARDEPGNQREIREFEPQNATFAGVGHVYVIHASPENYAKFARAWFSQTQPPIYRDAEGTFWRAFRFGGSASNADAPAPFHGALVLLDPEGHEVWHHTAPSPDARVTFEKFASGFREVARDSALREANLGKGSLALQGYDPVAYIDDHAAQKGEKSITSEYRGAIYRFASDESRNKFVASPETYLPTYGGWCATAMAEGEKVEIDPKNFKVTDGKVYLFYKGLLGNAIHDWNKDEANLRVKADGEWTRIMRARSSKPK